MKNYLLLTLTFLMSLSLSGQSLSGKHHIKYLEINTVQSDYSATLLEEDKLVFTSPANERSKNPQLDLFVGEIKDGGEIVNKERVQGLIGKKISKTGIAYSQDGKTVYFSAKQYRTRARSKDKFQLFTASVDSVGRWTDITKLAFNHKKYSSEQPALSKDGKKLYFVSDMPSSIGGKDIFVVAVNGDGTYGDPVNLGDKINTSGDEVTPYITENNILYFSSNGREGGLGNLDVFASEVFENSISDPLHLEPPVNSINDDFAYIVNSKNDRGYFSSNRLQGQDNNDIYAFTIEEEKSEKCLQEIVGIVRDRETLELLKDAAITLFDNDGNQVQQVVTDSEGAYRLSLDCSNTYTLVAARLHYNKEEHVVNTANYVNAPTLEADKFLVKTSDGTENTEVAKEEVAEEEVVESLSSIYFDFDKSNIREDATSELDKIVEIMKENANVKIEVSSFTDSRGSSAYNVKLSERRAKSTIDYIVSKGVDRDRLIGKGHGESRMLNKCINGVECTEASHAQNRRTEFAILNPQSYRLPKRKPPTQNVEPESLNSNLHKNNEIENTESTVAKRLDKSQGSDNTVNSKALANQENTGTQTVNKDVNLISSKSVSTKDNKANIVAIEDKTNTQSTASNDDKIVNASINSETLANQENIGNETTNKDINLIDKKSISIDDHKEDIVTTENNVDANGKAGSHDKVINSPTIISDKQNPVTQKKRTIGKFLKINT